MDKNFSSYLDSVYETLKKIVETLNEKYEYVSILATDCQGKNVIVSEKNISVKDNSYNERGFVIRVFDKGIYSEYSFDKITTAKDICDKVIESVDIQDPLYKAIYVKANKNDLYDEEEIAESFSKMEKYEDVSLDDIIKFSKKTISKAMEENEYIISATVNVENLKVCKIFLSSKKDLKQVYAWATASYQCIVNKNEVTKFNYGGESGVSLKDVLDRLSKKIKNINEDATCLLDSEKIEAGEYECITSPEVTGLIAHEAFGHGVEMDMFVKNRALAAKYIGEKVGSSLVEMHEGAIPYDDVSSYFFDDEGTLASDTVEIEKGILKTGIADAISASKLRIKPTGNGKRESFERKAYTRMTSTYFASKKSTLKEMISSIKYGYLLDGAGSGMEDPKHWGIQCIALIGKEIKDGQFTGKIVSPVVITGNVVELLNSISMVSKDFALYGTGGCGKGYKEWVKTSLGGPYLKVKVKLG